ncbi:MAG: hypothetical protein JWP55_4516 [Mycobacterium sp.]|nr:hypothetical protein [Mycobacterium sp.]
MGHPGRDRVDADVAIGQFDRGGDGERIDRTLRGAVDAHGGHTDGREPGTDVDGGTALVHALGRFLQHRDGGDGVDLECVADLVDGHVEKVAGVVLGGVVDHHVQLAVRVDGRGGQRCRRPLGGEVERDEGGVVPQFRANLPSAPFVAARDDHVEAVCV